MFLNDLIPDLYKSAAQVGRELVGVIPSATINTSDAVALEGQTVKSLVTYDPTLHTSITPAMTPPEGDAQTFGFKEFALTQTLAVRIPLHGRDQQLMKAGVGYQTVYGQQIARTMRVMANAIEAYAAGVIYKGASRAIGTAGTNPFASNFDLVAETRQILVDNGCPATDGEISLVINSVAGTKLRNLAQLQKANEAGSTDMLRRGVLLDLQGFMLRESAGIVKHIKGTGTGYLVDKTAGYVAGETNVALDTGSGTVKSGDIITFAGDTNKYVNWSSPANPSISLNEPGLINAAANNTAVTIGDNYTANLAFHRSAVEIAMRAPAVPDGGDMADDRMVVQDPVSGLAFDVGVYKGYRMTSMEISILYDVKVWNPAFVALMLG